MNAATTNSFRAGAAAVDITPPLGTLINGDFVTHYARWVHDPLYAKALVLEQGETCVALVLVDICAMPSELISAVKQSIQAVTGIKPENVLIASTHTHAGGSVMSLLLGAADLPYSQKLPALLVEAVRKAWAQRRPARVGFGAVDVPQHVLCRRYVMQPGYVARNPVTGGTDEVKTNPFGAESLIDHPLAPVDPQVSFMAVQGTDGNWLSVLANYSLHYVGDWPTGTLSADYFGVFARQLQQRLGTDDSFVGMMSNGTSGDVNVWDFRNPTRYSKEPFAKSTLIGSDIAEAVHGTLAAISWQSDPQLTVRYAEEQVATRKPTPTETEAARAVVADTDYAAIRVVNERALEQIYAREQVLLSECPDEITFPVQAIRVGSGVIGALGGEFFAETGLALRQAFADRPYFTVTMANGYVGYVPPAQEIKRGGYETWRCRTSFLVPNAEHQLRERLTELLHETLSE